MGYLPKPKDMPKPRTWEPFKTYPDGREECDLDHKAGQEEYKTRIKLMWVRQKRLCCDCMGPLALAHATFEHEIPRGLGGGFRDDRIEKDGQRINGAAHKWCNAERGSPRTPIYHGEEEAGEADHNDGEK